MKLPAFQFYPGDWMKDPSLRSCSLEARGLWMDMLCLMFESPIRGELRHANGRPINEQQLSRICGADILLIQNLTTELTDAGVLSLTDDGAIFSRRMKRDEEIRKIRAEAGKKGGNPVLVNQNGSKSEANDNQSAKQNPTPSSSSSTSNQLDNPSDYLARTVSKRSAPKPKAVLDYSTGTITGISQQLLSTWEEAYPAIDVREEIRKAKAWLLANPANRKKNLERFLNSWLSKAQDSAGRIKHAISGTDHIDNSAAGRVRAAVARSRAEREAAEQPGDRSPLADDGVDVRSQVVEFIRRGG